MGKRSEFKKRPQDTYYTWDKRAVIPLIHHLPNGWFNYCEPCAGKGHLVELLRQYTDFRLTPWRVYDIEGYFSEELQLDVIERDAFSITPEDIQSCDYIITNPPWTRNILHPMIDHFMRLQKPTWLLFDADWMHTKQASNYINTYCTKIVSVGRVRWIEDSKMDGKDNCAWYMFERNKREATKFYGRI